MSDAEVARLMQRRTNRTEAIEELLQAVEAQHGRAMQGLRRVPWIGIVAQPLPRPSNPNLLLPYMGTHVREWGQALLKSADQACERITTLRPSLVGWVPPTGAMPSPIAARWERTATGIAAQVTGADTGYGTLQGVPRRERLEIDRDATIRLMANYVSTYEGSSRRLQWKRLLAHAVGVIELANLIGDQLGSQYGLNIGLDVHQIPGHVPEPLYLDTHRQRRAEQLGELHPTPYQARRYRAHAAINAVQARGDLRDVLTHLFAGLLNSLGLPQLPT